MSDSDGFRSDAIRLGLSPEQYRRLASERQSRLAEPPKSCGDLWHDDEWQDRQTVEPPDHCPICRDGAVLDALNSRVSADPRPLTLKDDE